MDLSRKQLSKIDTLLFAGDIISAIREYRKFTSTSLSDAKPAVDARLESLIASDPNRFLHQPAAIDFDVATLDILKHVHKKILRPVARAQRKLLSLCNGFNYDLTLDVQAVVLPDHELPINEVILKCYPQATPREDVILRASVETMQSEVEEMIRHEGDSKFGYGPYFTDKERKQLNDVAIPEYWKQIDEICRLRESDIYEYRSETGIPGYVVYWFFAYLIHHRESKRCAFIIGSSSD